MKIKFPHSVFSFNKKNIQYGLIILGLYLLFLITTVPASFILSIFELPKNIKIASISGTIWSGKANQLQYSNIDLGQVKWKLHPLSLIIGELSADISIVNNEQYFKSEVSLSPSGKIELEETRFSIDLSLLQPLTYGMPFAYAGTISGYLPVSYFHENQHIGINGKLSLNGIKLISPQEQTFGDFVVDFRAEKKGATSGRINDVGGELNLSGQLTLSKNGQCNVSANLSAREGDGSLEQMLSILGKKDASGRFKINNSFKLWR